MTDPIASAMDRLIVSPRVPDSRYCELHMKCAAGTIADDERAELDLLCAMKEAEWDSRNGIEWGGK
jgi:hypothetical protein